VVANNVELARRAWEAFSRRDFDTQLEYIHPDLEWRPAQGPGGPEGSVYHGREAYARWLYDEVVPVWESFRGEDLVIRELEDGRILILGKIRGKGRASGVEVSAPFGQIAEIRDGMVIRLTGYMDHESALAAAGLRE
jgi:2-(1,2-epoxy-1,2-dihydrophenyl)acetyl-CoA isomerase